MSLFGIRADKLRLLEAKQLWPERIDAIAEKCVAAGFTMRVVQEAQRLHTLLEFVAQGFGVAIIPDPFRHQSDRFVLEGIHAFTRVASREDCASKGSSIAKPAALGVTSPPLTD
jgi:DNA-binding transcriptional LysR family regulator